MKTFGFILVCTLSSCLSSAQVWTWDTILGEKGTIQSVVDNQGNVITYTGNEITRYSNSLAVQWKLNLPSNLNITSLACLHDQSFYVLGFFTETIGINKELFVSKGKEDILFGRMNAWGEWIWVKQIGSPERDLSGEVAVLGFEAVITGGLGGGFIYDGLTYKKSTSLDLFVAKLKSDGSLTKIRIAKNDSSQPLSRNGTLGTEISISANGNICVLAQIAPYMRFTSLTLPGYFPDSDPDFPEYGRVQAFFRLDNELNGLWVGHFSRYQSNYSYLNVNSKGEIYYVNKQRLHHQGQQCSLIKIDSLGNRVSMFGMPTDYNSFSDIGDMTIDEYDNVTVGGIFSRWAGKPNQPLGNNFFVKEFSSSGNLLWQSNDSTYALCAAIRHLQEGRFIVTGSFMDTLFLRTTQVAQDSLGHSYPPYKTSRFMAIIDSRLKTNIAETSNSQDVFTAFPNPNSGTITIRTTAAGVLRIADTQGINLHEQELTPGDHQIDLKDRQAGLYIFSLKQMNHLFTQKIIVK